MDYFIQQLRPEAGKPLSSNWVLWFASPKASGKQHLFSLKFKNFNLGTLVIFPLSSVTFPMMFHRQSTMDTITNACEKSLGQLHRSDTRLARSYIAFRFYDSTQHYIPPINIYS